MHRLLKITFALWFVAVMLTSPVSAQDRAAVVQRLRAELATLLNKDAAQLPVDKPVTELGADDLDIVEWQMAAERAFRVDISDNNLHPKELSISSMAEIVLDSPPWPEGKTR